MHYELSWTSRAIFILGNEPWVVKCWNTVNLEIELRQYQSKMVWDAKKIHFLVTGEITFCSLHYKWYFAENTTRSQRDGSLICLRFPMQICIHHLWPCVKRVSQHKIKTRNIAKKGLKATSAPLHINSMAQAIFLAALCRHFNWVEQY